MKKPAGVIVTLSADQHPGMTTCNQNLLHRLTGVKTPTRLDTDDPPQSPREDVFQEQTKGRLFKNILTFTLQLKKVRSHPERAHTSLSFSVWR